MASKKGLEKNLKSKLKKINKDSNKRQAQYWCSIEIEHFLRSIK